MKLTAREKTQALKCARGTISIFLVLILLPILSVAGLIVDASRYQLAKAQVSVAGDLTMNAALADYDTVLKDVYGLFGTSQDIGEMSANSESDAAKELSSKLQGYFMDTLMAGGLVEDEDEIWNNPMLKSIMGVYSGKTGDLLHMQISTESDPFSIKGVAASSLANPAILKHSIVEYCKYRTPAHGIMSILEAVTNLSKTASQMDVASKEAAVGEAEGDYNKACEELYNKCVDYENKRSDDSFDNLLTVSTSGKTYSSLYQSALKCVVASEIADLIPSGMSCEGNRKGRASKYKVEGGSVSGDFSSGEVSRLLKYDNQKLNVSDLVNKVTPELDADEKNLDKDKKYSGPGYEHLKGYIEDLLGWADGQHMSGYNNSMLTDYNAAKAHIEKTVNFVRHAYYVERLCDGCLGSSKEDAEWLSGIRSSKGTTVATMMSRTAAYISNLSLFQNALKEKEDDATDKVKSVAEDCENKISKADELRKAAKTAKEKAENVQKKVEGIDTANGEFETSISTYKKNSNNNQDDEFSSGMSAEQQANKKKLSEAQVKMLKEFHSKLQTLESFYDAVGEYMKGLKFGGKKIKDIKSVGTLKDCTVNGTKVSQAFSDNPNLSVEQLWKDGFEQTVAKPQAPDTLSLKSDSFFIYLESKFKGREKKEDDNDSDKIKEKASETSPGSFSAEGSPGDVDDADSLPSHNQTEVTDAGTDADSYDTSQKYSSMLDNTRSGLSALLTGFSNFMENARDNLYVTDYAANMFSWNTQLAEYREEGIVEGGAKAQTESGVELSSENNKLYRAEIEYLLFGNTSSTLNVVAAKGVVFSVRFAMNSVFALTDSGINNATRTLALAVEAATLGFVPYKLAQIIFDVSLALMESMHDMYLMENGKKVAFVKTKDTFVFSSPGNVIKGAAQDVADLANHKVKTVLNDLLDSAIDVTADKVESTVTDLAADATDMAASKVNSAVDSMLNAFEDSICSAIDTISLDAAATSAESLANSIISEAESAAQDFVNKQGGQVGTVLSSVFGSLQSNVSSWAKSQVKTLATNAKSKKLVYEQVKSFKDNLANKIHGKTSALQASIKSKVSTFVNEKVSALSTKAKDAGHKAVNSAVDSATDKMAKATSDWCTTVFGSDAAKAAGGKGKLKSGSGLSNLLSFNYGDYLKMFLFIKLTINDSATLYRIADLIQMNINHGLTDPYIGAAHAKTGSFKLSNSYTYIQIDAKVELSTMFMAYPLITNYSNKQGVAAFEVPYKSGLGY